MKKQAVPIIYKKARDYKDNITGNGYKHLKRSKRPRPCIECGHYHMNNQPFCSKLHKERWEAKNPNQGKK